MTTVDDSLAPESGRVRAPTLVIEFELERPPRVLNGRSLSEAELRRVVDWIVSHDGGRLPLEEWLDRHIVARGIREPAK